jgi:predicted transcriptional regulator
MNAITKDPPLDDLRRELHGLADRLPDGATSADVQEYARFRATVDAGIVAADRGEFASDEEVRQVFAKWGVEFAGLSGPGLR